LQVELVVVEQLVVEAEQVDIEQLQDYLFLLLHPTQ
jgi:hypothetical protein